MIRGDFNMLEEYEINEKYTKINFNSIDIDLRA